MYKKIFTIVGVGAVALSVSTGEASAMTQGEVTTSVLNVRSGPGTTKSIIGKTYKGNVLEVLESSNGWHKVKLSNNKQGWVSGGYVKIKGSSNNTTTKPPTATPNKDSKGRVTTKILNVRSGPGTNNSIVGKVYSGNTVDIVSKSNGWYNIKLPNGKIGWCSGDYITLLSNSANDSNSDGTPAVKPPNVLNDKWGKVNTNGLNVRKGPGTSYSILSAINSGEVVQLIEKDNGWYKVKLNNGTVGWSSGAYINVVDKPGSNTSNNDSSNTSNNDSSNTSNNDSSNTSNNDSNNITPDVPTNDGPTSSKQQSIVSVAKSLIGTPYKYGAEGPDSFDCSGFTKYVYSEAVGMNIPRVSKDQARFGDFVSVGSYQLGDLVYFDLNGGGIVTHVGIYIGNGEFIHASGTTDNPEYVKVSNLTKGYFSDKVLGARRF